MFSDKSFITRFVVNGEGEVPTVIKNETDPVTFTCDVSSNPTSNITLHQDNVLRRYVSNTHQLTYEKQSTCDEAGLYTCSGSNQYNTETSTAQIQYHVRCKYILLTVIIYIKIIRDCVHICLKVILCASEHICSIVQYCFRSFK